MCLFYYRDTRKLTALRLFQMFDKDNDSVLSNHDLEEFAIWYVYMQMAN